MSRWRYRLARWLVGHYVQLPERAGVWVVQQFGDNAEWSVVTEADKFRMRLQSNLKPYTFGDGGSRSYRDYGRSRRTGRFVGTVKVE